MDKYYRGKVIVSKRGKYDGGTFAHPDIALEFASWIDPAFKLYLIQEFYQKQIIEYILDSIKENLVPTLTDKQKFLFMLTKQM